MFQIQADKSGRYCDGQSRRSFLKLGIAGLGTASLGEILRAKEATAAAGLGAKDTSVILLWLDGGPGHMDTYDMKPEAPVEYRGIWNPIPTNVPGMEVTELFPLHAKIADKFSVIRSMHHNNGDHFTAGHWMLTGRGAGVSGVATAGKHPFFGAVAAKQAGPRKPGLPAHAAIPYAMSIGLRPGYFGGNYIGVENDPFQTDGDPNAPNFTVQNLTQSMTIDRLSDRRSLSAQFDRLRRDVDRTGKLDAMDRFDRQAYEMVTGAEARKAFDISQEDDATRDLYGRHTWGQSTLLARRLVEAGSTFVSCHFGGWDHHWDLKKGYENYLPKIDQLVYGLFTDLDRRGLLEKTCVVLCGEFGRTPRMNDGGNGGAAMSMGTPGRDHWGNAMSVLIGGGGVKGGRIVGSTNRLGEVPQDRPLKPGDLHHSLFRVLGVDPHVAYRDRAGRPNPAIDHGEVISELF